jgi:hypothetical protein
MRPRQPLIALTILLLGCGAEPAAEHEERRPIDWNRLGKADSTMTCAGACGGYANGCWCDDLCLSYGDCCPDKVELCDGPGPSALTFYKDWEGKKAQVESAILSAHGKPFSKFDETDYAAWLATLDLTDDDQLMTWSVATEIPLLAVKKGSDFFYYNAQLIANEGGADLPYEKLAKLESAFNPATSQVELEDGTGAPLPTVTLKPGVIRRVVKTKGVGHNKGFIVDGVSVDTLDPYLVLPEKVPNRTKVQDGLKALPLSFVKALRGKGLYLSLTAGRSYAASGPNSNEIYEYFAGMMPGAFLEVRAPSQTASTLIHELCHMLDHTVVKNHYGSLYFTVQLRAFAALKDERDEVFGGRDDTHPKSGPGYISSYSRTNSSENFAEHCAAYIWKPADFLAKAQSEEQAGDALLKKKYLFMQKLLEKTAVKPELLSSEFIEKHLGDVGSGGGGGGGGGSSCQPGQTQDACCLDDLYRVDNLETLFASILAVGVQCQASNPKKVSYDAGYYYVGALLCTLDATPTQDAVDGFKAAAEAKGYYGYSCQVSSSGDVTIHGSTSTRLCGSYK